MRSLNPVRWFVRWADWFERRGVYVPGDDNRRVEAVRDFGWLITAWVTSLAVFILFFALAT